jgi:hypothetical protein
LILPSGGIAMQIQPKPEQRLRATRIRQAQTSDHDMFEGGAALPSKLPLTRPWKIGTGRLWNDRSPRPKR